MSRLTKWLDNKKAICIKECEKECVDGSEWCPKCKPLTDVLVKLADYEDKEEQGLLIELPVPLGTKVFCLDGVLDSIVINEWKFCVQMLDEWGEYVFATRFEAEEALAKMGGK